MRISDWSSDVCSSDLFATRLHLALARVGKVELLHVLDRVAGLRGAECLAHHPVQIDQLVMAQQVVDFYLPSAVQHGKPLESRLLDGGVVIDAGARVLGKPFDHEVDSGLEGGLLRPAAWVPERVVPGEEGRRWRK